jgi:hypothetical protein
MNGAMFIRASILNKKEAVYKAFKLAESFRTEPGPGHRMCIMKNINKER